MQFTSSPSPSDHPASATQEWCRDFALWFHEHGIAWSGTPAEFASQLSTAGLTGQQTTSDFPSQLLSLLELNTEELHELGVDVTINRARGRARTVILRSNGNAPLPASGSNSPNSERAAVDSEIAPLPPENTSRVLDWPIQVASQPATEQDTADTKEASEERSFNEFASLEFVTERSFSTIPLIVAVLVVLSGLAIFLVLYNEGAFASPAGAQAFPAPTTSEQQDVPGTQAAQQPASTQGTRNHSDPSPKANTQRAVSTPPTPTPHAQVESASLQTLTDRATRERDPAAQYELAMRYVDGRGVAADKVKGYTWLVVALNNGDARSDRALRDFSKRMSSLDLQQVRLSLGDMYSQGLGVPADLVAAHSWYALAEVAGSAEGTVRKKELESKMTPSQVEMAEEKTTSWLSHH